VELAEESRADYGRFRMAIKTVSDPSGGLWPFVLHCALVEKDVAKMQTPMRQRACNVADPGCCLVVFLSFAQLRAQVVLI